MDFWIIFWQITLIAAMAIFAVLAVVVTIGGFGNVLALFRSIDAQHAREDDDGDSSDGDAPQNTP